MRSKKEWKYTVGNIKGWNTKKNIDKYDIILFLTCVLFNIYRSWWFIPRYVSHKSK